MSKRDASRDASDSRRGGGFLRRLRDDIRGNTLAIVGAALVPLTAMIGSGVDMSRAYMAKTRLQSACDSAALAGRRVMQNDTLSTTVIDESRRFFNFNFPQGIYQTATFTPVVTRPSTGTVRVSASTTIPTTIMKMFGFTTLPLNVTCEAALNFVNTDVMLVLDTTGSMNSYLAGTRKIDALQDAVLALYDALAPTQAQLEANNLRLRYGIVSYSTTVNVGAAVRAINPSYLSDNWTYNTRTPIFATSSAPVRVGTSMTSSQCNAYVQPRTPSNDYPSTEKVVARPGSGTNRPCDVTTITYTEGTGANFVWWIHQPAVLDTAQFKLGSASVPLPTRVPGTSTNATAWSGCIEERDTVNTITGTYGYDIPPGAYDLDINLIPNSPDTRWRPQWLQVNYNAQGGNLSTTTSNGLLFTSTHGSDSQACPAPARPLQAWTRLALETYVNSLTPQGYTYHDIGMIWGARMLSNGGIFGPGNPDTWNGMPVTRHIIFMTDGDLVTQADAYTAYGIEALDERVTGGNGDQQGRHMQRFRMMCNAARGMGFSVWVIAFGTTLTNDMRDCASNAQQASTSADGPALIARFRQIGANIGALRLTQ
jgi:Flp pilus assembly protein TadG